VIVRLETSRLVLRGWEPATDGDAFGAMNADPCVMRFVGEGRPLDRAESDELLDRIAAHWREHGFGLWAVQATDGPGELLGFCGLAVPSFLPAVLPAVEVGWRLRRDAWGRGYATEAARAAVLWGAAELGLEEVIAIVDPRNEASLRVAAKLGMTRGRDRVHPVSRARLAVLRRKL
jgi:RimJ/RimL family protein N-acetyltransferase